MIDEKTLEIIKEMTETGFVPRKIAADLKIQQKEIKEIIKINNFRLIKEKYDEIKIPKLITLYNQGISVKLLEEKFTLDHRKIKIILNNNGIKTLKVGENPSYLKINEHIFDIIDNEEKAYWYAFLCTDGCVRKVTNKLGSSYTLTLKLQLRDKNHLLKFVKFMGGDEYNIKYETRNTTYKGEKKTYYACFYKICNKHLVEQLTKLGCMPKKTFKLKYPKWLREDLRYHFLRGATDGDGCISKTKKYSAITELWSYNWSLIGTEMFCQAIQKLLKKDDINVRITNISKNKKNTSKLECSGNLQVNRLLDLMYNEATVLLERKYEKYIKLKQINDIQDILRTNNFVNHGSKAIQYRKAYDTLLMFS